jgi:hypothetical protein
MDPLFWNSLPTKSKLTIELQAIDPNYFDDLYDEHITLINEENNLGNMKLTKINENTYTFTCIYSHICVDDVNELNSDSSRQIYFYENDTPYQAIEYYDNEIILLNTYYSNDNFTLTIKNIKPSNDYPLCFVSIANKYYDRLTKNYAFVHLAYDYMDQGWTDIINGENLDLLKKSNGPMFELGDDGHIFIFQGEGFWINKNDICKL